MQAVKHPLGVVTAVLALVVTLLAGPPASASVEPASVEPASVEPAKAAQGTISGTVTFRGKPVRNLWVGLVSKKQRVPARTDANGRFSAVVPRGTYVAHAFTYRFSAFATFSGSTVHRADAKRVKVRKGTRATLDLDLIPSATVKGKVVDAEGRPVRRAEVSVWNTKRAGEHHEIRTDAKGRFKAIHLATGKVKVRVTDPSGSPAARRTVTVRAVEGKTVRAGKIQLRTPKRGRLTVDVHGLDDADGHVWVRAYNLGSGSWKTLLQPDPDEAPERYATRAKPGRWQVIISGTSEMSSPVKVRADRTVHAGEVTVPTVFTELSGQVLRPNGKPLKKGVVNVLDPHGGPVARALTDAQGRYTASGIPGGSYTVEAKQIRGKLPPVTAAVEVDEGVPATSDLRLERGFTVKGRVLHRGKGVRGVKVLAVGATSTLTGKKGKFALRHVLPGRYVVWARDGAAGGFKYKKKVVHVDGRVTGVRFKVKK